MPYFMPSAEFPLRPRRRALPAGTQLWRVHRREYAAGRFNSRASDVLWGGGRFDGTPQCPYAYMYAAFGPATAVAETMLRGMPFLGRRPRILARCAVNGRRLSALTLAGDIELLALTTTPALAGVGQDEWLVHAEPMFYGQTRDWAHWMRDRTPWAHGLIWPSKRDLGQEAIMLFGDRCGPDLLALEPGLGLDLDDEPGRVWLNTLLADYRVHLNRPSSGQAGQAD
jgi:hypothetical protein